MKIMNTTLCLWTGNNKFTRNMPLRLRVAVRRGKPETPLTRTDPFRHRGYAHAYCKVWQDTKDAMKINY